MLNTIFKRVAILAGAAALLAAGGASAVPIASTFNANAEGWNCVGDCTSFTHVGTGGNPGGFIRASDQSSGILWYFSAPGAFLGNQSSAYGLQLRFDLQDAGGGTTTDGPGVWLSGGGLDLVLDITPPDPPTTPTWRTYDAMLLASSGWTVGTALGGPAASEAQLQTVLANLTSLRIRGEYINGADTGGLDNVQWGVVPEPGTLLILSLGLGLLGWAGRRRA